MDTWRQIEDKQDSVGLLILIRGTMYRLKQKKFGTVSIVDDKYKLNTATHAPEDSIEQFHRVFLVQLVTVLAH